MAFFSEATMELNNRSKINYLRQYVWLGKEIDRKYAEIKRLKSKLGKITATISTQPGGGGSIYKSKDLDLIDEIVDLEIEILKEIEPLLQTRREITEVITNMDEPRERLLLQYRYLDGLSWEKIAVEMNYSWQHMHLLHSRSLKNIQIMLRVNKSIDCDII